MLKLVTLCCFLFATCSATHFLFGVEITCALDDTFAATISHWEDDGLLNSDEQISFRREVVTAYKKIYIHQKGHQTFEYGDFEPYGWFYHNCTKDGKFVTYKKKLAETSKKHGLEFVEYTVDLTDAWGTR